MTTDPQKTCRLPWWIDYAVLAATLSVVGLFIYHAKPGPAAHKPLMGLAGPTTLAHGTPRPKKCLLPIVDETASDGDTIDGDILLPYGLALYDAHVRLTGFDAWESRKTRRTRGPITAAEIKRGKAAQADLAALLRNAKAVWLEPDPAEFDAFGRPLGRLYIDPPTGPTIDVAVWMIGHDHDRDLTPSGKPRR